MNRLTKENIIEAISNGQTMFVAGRTVGKTLISRVLSEILEYKNIEEELGLDLGIFVKMLKHGGYIKTVFGIEKFKTHSGNIDFKGKMFYVITEHTLRTLLFKDYGKT